MAAAVQPLPVELSENMLQNIFLNLPPHPVCTRRTHRFRLGNGGSTCTGLECLHGFGVPVSLARLLDVVRGDDDGGAARVAVVVVVGHGGEVVPDGGAEQRVHAHCRLVQDEELRLVEEGDGERGAPLLSAAHVDQLALAGRQVEELHQEVDPLAVLLEAHAWNVVDDFGVLLEPEVS